MSSGVTFHKISGHFQDHKLGRGSSGNHREDKIFPNMSTAETPEYEGSGLPELEEQYRIL